jgi:hypothetical protein
VETGPSVPNPPTSKAAPTRVLYALLFIYAGAAGTYQIVNAVSTPIGFFNLRNQVQAPFQLYGNLISSPTAAARHAGLAKGNTVLAINQAPFTGMALCSAFAGTLARATPSLLTVRKQNGTIQITTIPLEPYPAGYSVDDCPSG